LVPKTRRVTILCVDDEGGALHLRKVVLENAGYAVVAAATAEEAFSVFNSNTIDLVISDHLLPGASGAELADRIKAVKPDIPVMLLSGVTDRPPAAHQIDRFITKGEGPQALLKHVAELLRYRRLRIKLGEYEALIACDTQQLPNTWHYVIQCGPRQIISWSQERSQRAAITAAKKELASLSRRRNPPHRKP
jgi:DNA-binding NtrC family response regulator